MSPLPLPIRIAAGLAVTAVDQVRKLPIQLAGLPVTVASRALQMSMRVQQQVTELAIKGDEVFASFRAVDDTPPWARFDEDDELDRRGDDAPLATVFSGPGGSGPGGSGPGGGGPEHRSEIEAAADRAGDGEIDEADVAQALASPPDAPAGNGTFELPARVGASPSGSGPPPAMPGYDELSLPQLRAKLRTLSVAQLESLLAHEQRHQDRPPFVTMLTNRITTVRSR